jgi:hypothetical protein
MDLLGRTHVDLSSGREKGDEQQKECFNISKISKRENVLIERLFP